ncbi:MAG: HD-GYP domain-containing protein, partial [Actinomycetota bacterium]
MAAASFVMVQVVFASYRRLVESEREVLAGLVAAVEEKDPYTAGHSQRVGRYARMIAEPLGWKGKDLARLVQQATMHDIGKLAVPNHILRKPDKFTAAEREIMFRHETTGAAILAEIPFLTSGGDIAAGVGHRGGFDGPVTAAHVVHMADAFDAMTSSRAYRDADTQQAAFVEMRAKAGIDFHPECVDTLIGELTARGEVHGLGHETDRVVYDTPPPKKPLGDTLDDQAAADGRPRPAPVKADRPPPPELARDTVAAVLLSAVAAAAAVVAATVGGTVASAVAYGALVAAGEVICLRPAHRRPRPLSYVPALVALAALAFPAAAAAIGVGLVVGTAVREGPTGPSRIRHLASRVVALAAMAGAYAAMHDAVSGGTGQTLGVLVAAAAAAMVAQELVDTRGHVRFGLENRVADLAVVTAAPLTALAIAGTATVAGLGFGTVAVVVLPIGLRAPGYVRNARAHDNLMAWMRACAIAPEHAGLVVPGRAERIATLSTEIARRAGLDPDTVDQLEAAAWMERVGECSLDESYVTGEPHRPDDIVAASAAILKTTRDYYPAGQILYASLNEPELATTEPLDRAGQVLRVVIAYENATSGDIEVHQIPELVARLRTNTHHSL